MQMNLAYTPFIATVRIWLYDNKYYFLSTLHLLHLLTSPSTRFC